MPTDKNARRTFLKGAGSVAVAAVLPAPPAPAAELPGQITAVTLIHGLPGKDRDLREHLLSLAGPTRAEPGCITYDLYQSSEQNEEFMRLEVTHTKGSGF